MGLAEIASHGGLRYAELSASATTELDRRPGIFIYSSLISLSFKFKLIQTASYLSKEFNSHMSLCLLFSKSLSPYVLISFPIYLNS
jgi:hypothetical protein